MDFRRLFAVTVERSLLAELAVTALRVFYGLALALGHGLSKLPPSERFVGGVGEMGFPAPTLFAWAAALSEFGGGLLVALGLFTRLGALGIAGTMAVAAFIRHAQDPFGDKELALVYFVVALVFLVRGAGKFSVDYLMAGPRTA